METSLSKVLFQRGTMDDIRKVKSISTDKIKLIISIIFKDEDIVKTSKSIKEIGYPPLIVRCTTDGNYQLCSHPEIFKLIDPAS